MHEAPIPETFHRYSEPALSPQRVIVDNALVCSFWRNATHVSGDYVYRVMFVRTVTIASREAELAELALESRAFPFAYLCVLCGEELGKW